MQRLGIIDIGSNSIRLIIFEIFIDAVFRQIHESKEMVRLGQTKDAMQNLSMEKMIYAIETLKVYLQLCKAFEVDEIICTATEAVRRAPNKAEFLNMVNTQAGLKIRILTGIEEAYYDYYAVIHTMNLQNCLIMDIGGSSTELVLMENKKIINSISLPIGALSITEMFNLNNVIGAYEMEEMGKFIMYYLLRIDWLKSNLPLVGIGGSFRNLSKIDRKLKKYPYDNIHNYQMSNDSANIIFDLLRNKTLKQRASVKGLSQDRVDIFCGALAILVTLLEYTKIEEIRISRAGLREGLAYENIFNGNKPVDNILDISLHNLIHVYKIDRKHAEHVWNSVYKLYHQLEEMFSINENMDNILKTAALLHDCGICINYENHHKHSFYIILNSPIYGLSHKELIIAASVAALHRKEDLKILASYQTLLNIDEIQNIRKLGLLLRIAEGLDKRHDQTIYKIECCADNNIFSIRVFSKMDAVNKVNDIKNMQKCFKENFNINLQIEQVNGSHSIEKKFI